MALTSGWISATTATNVWENLNRCTKGFVALWLKAYVATGNEYYVNSGGHTSESMGMTLLKQNGNLLAGFRTESMHWRVDVAGFESHVWYHVVLVWTAQGGEQVLSEWVSVWSHGCRYLTYQQWAIIVYGLCVWQRKYCLNWGYCLCGWNDPGRG